MELTPELLNDYEGHEMLLRVRARFQPHCHPLWDRLRDCIVGKEEREEACAAYARAFKPCSLEGRRQRAVAAEARADERRRALASLAKEKHAASEGAPDALRSTS